MKRNSRLLLALFLAIAVGVAFGFLHLGKSRDTLFQVSTIQALLQGIYDGNTTSRDLRKHGDFGLGTFNALDGEMVVYDGKVYQVKTDGVAYLVKGSEKTPFAAVTFFEKDRKIPVHNISSLSNLKEYLDGALPTKNIFYAIKIEGTFDYIKTRSVPAQEKPYPPLVNVVKKETTFEFDDVKGVIIGFRCPDFVKNINVPGYHFHFLTADKKRGGHLLDCSMNNLTAEIDDTDSLCMKLLKTEEFYKANLTDEGKNLNRVEGK